MVAKQNATEYGEMGKLLLAGRVPRSGGSRASQRAVARTGRDDLAVLPRSPDRKKGDIRKATVAFERALRLTPTDVPTMTWLGEATLDRGRPDAAEPLFTKAVSLEPRAAAAHYGLGRAALGQKGLRGAARHLEQALALDWQRVGDPLFAGDGATEAWATSAEAALHLQQRGTQPIKPDPLMKALDESAQQRADLREERGRRRQQRRVDRPQRSI